MKEGDITDVQTIGEVVHPDYPEDLAIIAERLRLYPPGCLVLASDQGVQGYAVAHPYLFGQAPRLNVLLESLPARADTLHIHDLALLPHVRSGGLGAMAVGLLARQAELSGLTKMSLVAVGNSQRFWARHGFQALQQENTAAALSSYKGATLMVRVLA